jgi:hypothetical protein
VHPDEKQVSIAGIATNQETEKWLGAAGKWGRLS